MGCLDHDPAVPAQHAVCAESHTSANRDGATALVALANTGAAPSPAGSIDGGSPEQRWAPDDPAGLAGGEGMSHMDTAGHPVESSADAARTIAVTAEEAAARPELGAVGLGGTTASEVASDMPMRDAGAQAEPDARTGAAAGLAAAMKTSDAASDAFYSRIAALAGTGPFMAL